MFECIGFVSACQVVPGLDLLFITFQPCVTFNQNEEPRERLSQSEGGREWMLCCIGYASTLIFNAIENASVF